MASPRVDIHWDVTESRQHDFARLPNQHLRASSSCITRTLLPWLELICVIKLLASRSILRELALERDRSGRRHAKASMFVHRCEFCCSDGNNNRYFPPAVRWRQCHDRPSSQHGTQGSYAHACWGYHQSPSRHSHHCHDVNLMSLHWLIDSIAIFTPVYLQVLEISNRIDIKVEKKLRLNFFL